MVAQARQFGDKQFNDKVVWITGAGTGIGKAVAAMFACEGATLALLGRRRGVLEPVGEEALRLGARAEVVPLDVTERAAVQAAAARLLSLWERVDILVNNAGINVVNRKLSVLPPEDWDRVLQVNLTGAYNMIAAVLPPMRRQGGGLIVNISSMAGKRVSGLSGAAYAASKHGLTALNESINVEEGHHGIRATAVCPGEVDTEILDKRPVPLPPEERARLIGAGDVAAAVRFLAGLPARTTVPELLMMPTHRRILRPEEVR